MALSVLLGTLLALCGLPLPWSALTPLALAGLLAWLTAQGSAKHVGAQTWWAMTAYFAVQLSWLVAFMHNLMLEGLTGVPDALVWLLAGAALLPLFVLEGGFWAAAAYLVGRVTSHQQGRVWLLAGSWVFVEWARTLGPLAFPWAGLGYTLLPTPLVQAADLVGVTGLSLLVAASAAALATARVNARPPLLALLVWGLGLGYGLTRTPVSLTPQNEGRALLLRTDGDSFSKAAGFMDALWQSQLALSVQRQPGEVLIWSETALPDLSLAPGLPEGVYGLSQRSMSYRNTAIGWNGQHITGTFEKAHPVPFGEYYPLAGLLPGVYTPLFKAIGFTFEQQYPAQTWPPIALSGVLYGVYICYDSIFPAVTRHLSRAGAQVLVNISNDGWYTGWGVWQHFNMGRVRAIETRRTVLRSVNRGVAAQIDDLGRPVQTLTQGAGVLHARYARASGQTLYTRWGEAPALLLALALCVYGWQVRRAL